MLVKEKGCKVFNITTKITESLFGDDLLKQIKEISKTKWAVYSQRKFTKECDSYKTQLIYKLYAYIKQLRLSFLGLRKGDSELYRKNFFWVYSCLVFL